MKWKTKCNRFLGGNLWNHAIHLAVSQLPFFPTDVDENAQSGFPEASRDYEDEEVDVDGEEVTPVVEFFF